MLVFPYSFKSLRARPFETNVTVVLQITTGPSVQSLKRPGLKYILLDKLKHSIRNEVRTYFLTSLVTCLGWFASAVVHV